MKNPNIPRRTGNPASSGLALTRAGQSQPWLFIMLFLTVIGLGLVAAPGVSQANANNGTVPPPPPEPLTILVGPVDGLPEDGDTATLPEFTVAGVPISLATDVQIDERVGALVNGAWARVEGNGNGSGGLIAQRIKVLLPLPTIRLTGPLDSLIDTELVVDGIALNRTITTLIIGDPVAGTDNVAVRAAIESTGQLLALQVVKVDPIPDDPDDDDEEDELGKVKLIGIVESMSDDGAWVVSGIPVQVTNAGVATTKIHARVGLLLLGAWVKITGQVEDGILVAERIHTTHSHKFHKLKGTLVSLTPLTVNVGGIELDLSDAVSIQGNPQPGDRVTVKALPDQTGVLLAVLVEARGKNGPPELPGLVVRFTGRVDELPVNGLYGQWEIAGRPVNVLQGAFIDEHKGEVEVGAFVEVTALLGPNGSLTAVVIVVTRDNNDDDDEDGNHHGGHWKGFYGPVESLPADENLIGDWVVDGITVHVSNETDLDDHGQGIEVGDKVKVWGWLQEDGSVRARRIEIKEEPEREVFFIGVVNALPQTGLVGLWTVGEHPVAVSEQTHLNDEHGSFAVGKRVKVYGRQQSDGTVRAGYIATLREPEVQFIGRIVAFPAGLTGDWTVAEKTVVANDQTEFLQHNGSFAVGVLVRVKGQERAGGVIEARKIETLPLPRIEYVGEIVILPATDDLTGFWTVGPLPFEVTEQTELWAHDGQFAVGVWVRIYGRSRADGTFLADKIQLLHDHH